MTKNDYIKYLLHRRETMDTLFSKTSLLVDSYIFLVALIALVIEHFSNSKLSIVLFYASLITIISVILTTYASKKLASFYRDETDTQWRYLYKKGTKLEDCDYNENGNVWYALCTLFDIISVISFCVMLVCIILQ
jgi:cell division protein FtsL